MNSQTASQQVKIQRLASIEDLPLLIQGDIVEIVISGQKPVKMVIDNNSKNTLKILERHSVYGYNAFGRTIAYNFIEVYEGKILFEDKYSIMNDYSRYENYDFHQEKMGLLERGGL